jgi:ankyrin repeat protein
MSTLNNYGWTALHYAARFDNLMAAEMLIMEGAKISQRDPIGKTPLDYAESAAMIKLLKSNAPVEQ